MPCLKKNYLRLLNVKNDQTSVYPSPKKLYINILQSIS